MLHFSEQSGEIFHFAETGCGHADFGGMGQERAEGTARSDQTGEIGPSTMAAEIFDH